ncbi:MAG: protein kinase [Acidobacteria bacterium]|nr:protein kinase [Acidobacteriota bacterium]
MTPHLSPGTRAGPFEILRLAGSGGMGEVYESLDTRLGRRVALKILLPGHAWDRESFRRFALEARSIGSINHPNIVVVHTAGEHEGLPYIVTEFLEGQTLGQRLQKGGLPLAEALRVSREVAEGLSAVHARGIIHRDLKPENIFLTASGVTKLLDFGLAKDLGPGPAEPDKTAPGEVVGTPAYMSPEQIQGLAADARSDLFALASVLHESLTGRPCFSGSSIVETFHAILRRRPPRLAASGVVAPETVQGLLDRCHAQEREERFASAGDVAFAISCIEAGLSDPLLTVAETKSLEIPALPPPHKPSPARFQRGLAITGVVAVLAAGFFARGFLRTPIPERPVLDVTIETPSGTWLGPALALSENGQRLLFEAATLERGQYLLWLRKLESPASAPLFGTESGFFPFWAPSGEAFGFFSSGKLKISRLSPGVPEAVADAPRGLGGTWNGKDQILFSRDFASGLTLLDLGTRSLRAITSVAASSGHESHRFPQFLPGGSRFIFFVKSEDPQIEGTYAGSLDGTPPVRILATRSRAVYAEDSGDGKTERALFWTAGNDLMAAPFDPATGRLGAAPAVIASGLQTILRAGYGGFSCSRNGLMTLVTDSNSSSRPAWLDRSGRILESYPPGLFRNVALAPDGSFSAAEKVEPATGERRIVLFRNGRVEETGVPRGSGAGISPLITPDSQSIVFTWDRNGSRDLFLSALGGTEPPRLLWESPVSKYPSGFSPDGRFLLVETRDLKSFSDLWILEDPLSPRPTPRPLLTGPANEAQARFSPDGRFIVYASDESGRWQVYARSFPEFRETVLISRDGGTDPHFGSRGSEVFYFTADGRLAAARVEERNGKLAVTATSPLFGLPVAEPLAERSHFAPSRDGARFFVNTSSDTFSPASLRLLQGWRRLLAPAGGGAQPIDSRIRAGR